MKVLLLASLLIISYNSDGQKRGDSLLNVLKSEIKNKRLYDSQKERKIEQLKKQLGAVHRKNLQDQYTLCEKLFDEYKDYKFDSAYVYSKKLLHLGRLMHDLPKEYNGRVNLASIQLSGGMFKETFIDMSQININMVPDSIKLRYYGLKSRALKDLAMYNTDKFYSRSNHEASVKVLDSALILTEPGSYEKIKRTAELLDLSGKKDQAYNVLRKLLTSKQITDHQRAMIAYDMSNLATGSKRTNLITLSAIYDIRSSAKQTLASFKLGSIFFKQGQLDNAELLLKEAVDQAQFYGNKLNEREALALLTQVSAQKLINSETSKNDVLTILIVIVSITLVGIGFVSYNVYSRLKKIRIQEAIVQGKYQHLDLINKKLLEDGHIKEEYIGYFFKLISGYILKLEKIKRVTERKVKTEKYGELLQMANEIDIKQERRSLFNTFDNTFIKLFPNFVSKFNELFRPEDQIWPKDHEILNTNLRIFALIRLGIKDNQTIANILENTVGTIYAYKNRAKLKSIINDDEFEQKIMEIKFVDQ